MAEFRRGDTCHECFKNCVFTCLYGFEQAKESTSNPPSPPKKVSRNDLMFQVTTIRISSFLLPRLLFGHKCMAMLKMLGDMQ